MISFREAITGRAFGILLLTAFSKAASYDIEGGFLS